ncbi:ubiquitin-conjugating enzyme E2-binding protein [Aspergillus minisclerotigenes]|uniref:Ubiquitin-conjugating enzyme E2-binding protein n=1 Tax=Aspergillus minisclerotigenes TaxID=656917 RepID=A0A5N6IKW9_9EURO|nr:ubiquitin-conjugating enzyme E2-binding protein [Aspergillus minisclerotigenes]
MSAVHQENESAALCLHAELLPNIRHITLYVSLPEAMRSQNVRPEICLSDSRRAITVSLPLPHEDATDTIKLPARVNEASRLALSVAGQRAKDPRERGLDQQEYSFRMQIDDEDNSLLSREEHMDSFVPWTAIDMTSCTRLCCRHCKNILLDSHVSRGSCAEEKDMQGWMWKDLPSGNWAEMMDFWHCHKPDPHEGHDHGHEHVNGATAEDQNATVKGYGAANQVVATAGTVLVDVATFLLTDSDCRGLKQVLYSNPTPMHDMGKKEGGHFITMLWSSIQLPYNYCFLVPNLVETKSTTASPTEVQMELLCENCNSLVGVEDIVAKGWRLFKTSLSVSKQFSEGECEDPEWECHSFEVVVAAQLLELIERESARRFVLHCEQGDGLLIWVFNPDMRYSNSSSDHSITAQRAMKILFQDVVDVDGMLHPDRGKASSLSLEELRLPSSVLSAIQGSLENGKLASCIDMTGQRMLEKRWL